MAIDRPVKLHGRAFFESIGSPRHIVAPMVDQSEFAWRLLTRSFLPPDLRRSVLCYSPMFHARLFAESFKYRDQHFTPVKPPPTISNLAGKDEQPVKEDSSEAWLDGNHDAGDRPLFVQFCANDPHYMLEAAKLVQPYCDAVDLNLGCPQGIAKRGHYGAFLQEDWDTIHKLINALHLGLDIPVTAKMRILETKEKTLDYAKMILSAGASLITVHGRQREQKGHNTGLADWQVLRYLREQLPPETVIFANGNILQYDDIQKCLDQTRADGVMSAEGNLYDPAIFAAVPDDAETHPEYFLGRDGKGGWRMDAVLRRYMDLLHTYVIGQDPPKREPLFQLHDAISYLSTDESAGVSNVSEHLGEVKQENGAKRPADSMEDSAASEPPSKRKRKIEAKIAAKQAKKEANERRGATKVQQKKSDDERQLQNDANFVAMKSHIFHLLRPLVSRHHDVRNALAHARAGDIDAYEYVLTLTEQAVKKGLMTYARDPESFYTTEDITSSNEAVLRCRRPYFVCQPHVRPLPHEAIEKGSMQLSKKEKAKLEKEAQEAKEVHLSPEGKTHLENAGSPKGQVSIDQRNKEEVKGEREVEVPKEGLVCG